MEAKTRTNFWIMLLMYIAFAMAGCEGEQGPIGETGPQGAQGPQGIQGIAGAAGKDGGMFYSGNGVPAATLGKVGDMYLNTTTSGLYGPKTASGWGTPLNLKGATGATGTTGATGATGAAGTPGSVILSGTATPAATLGKIGDYYLDRDDFLLYGPKTAAGWGVGILLRGRDGNANVVTGVFTLTNADWLWSSTYWFTVSPTYGLGYQSRYSTKNFAAITSSVLNTGAVLVYFTSYKNKPDQWAQLPFSFLDFSGEFDYNIANETNIGTIKLHYFYTKNGVTGTVPNLSTAVIADYKFKVVVIASSSSTTIARLYPDIDFSNYEQVSKAFNLD